MAFQAHCITKILVNRKFWGHLVKIPNQYWDCSELWDAIFLLAHMTKEAKITERHSWETCADHLAIKGTLNKPYAFSVVLFPHLLISDVSHIAVRVVNLVPPFLHSRGGTGFWSFPIGDEASDPLVHSTPHMLSTVRRGMTNPGENHLVVPLKLLSPVSSLSSCPHSSCYQSTFTWTWFRLMSFAADRGQSSPGAFRFTLPEGIHDSGLKGKEK